MALCASRPPLLVLQVVLQILRSLRNLKVDTRHSTLEQASLIDIFQDCLFLDVYVPAKAVANPSLKLPVVSWFYGGAYIFGGKDSFEPLLPFYDGTGLIQQSAGDIIFVASNYRVCSIWSQADPILMALTNS